MNMCVHERCAAVSGGAKWASAESRKGGKKSGAHDTSQPHYTMEGRERACTPAALTMIPLPRSLTPSPSSGSHQDSDDLMMRETTLIIHMQQTSPLAALLSLSHTLARAHTYSGLAHLHRDTLTRSNK